MNVRISESGKIVKFLVNVDDDVEIGTDYVEIDTDAKNDTQSSAQKKDVS